MTVFDICAIAGAMSPVAAELIKELFKKLDQAERIQKLEESIEEIKEIKKRRRK